MQSAIRKTHYMNCNSKQKVKSFIKNDADRNNKFIGYRKFSIEYKRQRKHNLSKVLNKSDQRYAGAPVAFKTWCGPQYRVGIICPIWLR